MAYNQHLWYRKLFSTSHRILLNRLLKKYYNKAGGKVLILGAGREPYRNFLASASCILLSDIEMRHNNLDLYVDAHSIPFPDSSFDSILAVEVFEHLYDPALAASEIYRTLKHNGIAILSIPFMFHIHGDPNDYQRFTKAGIQSLFKAFCEITIIPFGSRTHVISDIVTTWSKPLSVFRVINWLLTLPFVCAASLDCPSGYIILLRK